MSGPSDAPAARLAAAFPSDLDAPDAAGQVEPLLPEVGPTLRAAREGAGPADPALLAAAKAAAFLLGRERWEEARALLEDAAETARAARSSGRLGEPFLGVLVADQLAAAAQAAERPGQAREASAEAEALAREVLPGDDPRLPMILNNAGSLLKQQGDFLAAEVHFRRVLSLAEEHHDAPGPLSATASLNLSDVLRARGSAEEAERFARRAAEEVESLRGTFNPETADAIDNLGQVLRELGREEEAGRCFRRVEAIYHRSLGPEHPLSRRAAARLRDD